jgi:quercetin dioxygenase-like cupin family protein
LGALSIAPASGTHEQDREEFTKVRNFGLVKAMQIGTKSISALLLATIMMAPAAGIPATTYNETVKTNFSHRIPNIPGKSLVAVEVSYPPGGASPPHHHSDSAFIYAYVVSGQIASQAEGQPEHIYHAGECWYEMPGSHHLIGRNASNTEPAKLLAVFVADTGDNALTIPDHEGGSR